MYIRNKAAVVQIDLLILLLLVYSKLIAANAELQVNT